MHFVERTCTEILAHGSGDQIQVRPQPLSAYRSQAAYVLLGDPGAGKTTAFEQEAKRERALYITARDLTTFEDRPEWHDKTLFIDGLDEIRAGSLDARTPFDSIRARLDRLGRPVFRLSCREADWFGASDQERLKSVSADGQVAVLHINPLTELDIIEILKHNPRVLNIEEFMQWAEQKGLNELLTNPQILDMLAKAVADGNWPSTRKQTFEMACQTIIREHNLEHGDATRTQAVDEKQQLNAVGFLCAVQLIAGNAGYALTHERVGNDFPYLGDSGYDTIGLFNGGLLNEAARTKLFKTPIEGRISPVHRHVAEYLAARYLADHIERTGLPIARILALITGEDGVVVAELRGLSAWLAALCKNQRRAIIERDPLGVVLYGDVQDFTRQDKRHVLDGLQREAARYPWFRFSYWTASPFGVLATPDMEEEFREILVTPDRNETHQALVDCVLDAMTHGHGFPTLDDTLLNIVRDVTWWPRIRQQALRVLQRHNEGLPDSCPRLKVLLGEINNGTVEDPDDELMGYLLTILYPQSIPAQEVLNYLHSPKQQYLIGRYRMFWRQNFLKQSPASDVNVILDELASWMDKLRPILVDEHYFRDFTTELLAQGLGVYGEQIEPVRLYGWLGVGLDKYGSLHSGEYSHAHADNIRSWLEARPAIQKDIIGIGLEHCAKKEHFRSCMNKVHGRLYRAKPPADYGRWCLERLQAATNNSVARYLLQEAVDAGLSLDTIEEFTEQEPKYKTWLNEMLVSPVELETQEYIKKQRLRKDEEYEKKQQWLRHAKSHESELRGGRAYPSLLRDLANVYFGYFIHSRGDTPIERLRNFLEHDEDLVQAALIGLRRALERDDIPEVADIIQLYTDDQTYLLCLPILAGLKEIAQTSSNYILQLSDKQIRQALAFQLTGGTGEDPDWYKSLLASRPDLVAEVMMAYVTASLRCNKQHITGLYALAYLDAYNQVARLASLIMLNTFPVRSTNQQLGSLNELLIAALRYADRRELFALIEKKLKLRSMNVAQRVRWLAAGLIIAPEKYMEPLANFTKGQEKRIQHLANFLADRHDQWSPLDDLPISVLGLLVCLIGEFFATYTRTGWVSPAMNAADFVERLISHLGLQPGKEATDMLGVLLANNKLCCWHPALQRARFEQRAVRREASFHHPGIRQVTETLNNLAPANAGDLAALITVVLHELADQIRNANTDDYHQFWNHENGPQPKLTTPKHEEICRNALLSDLKQRLAPLGIDAQPEGHYADNKRADIRIAFGGANGFEVPVEIKKNTHTKLWSAINDQLIAKYTREPRAHDFGIYLVFWFGADVTQPPPSGQRPRTAAELEKRLRETLTADENRKISVCVIDVAKPE